MRNLIFYFALINDGNDRQKFEQMYRDYSKAMFVKAKTFVQDDAMAEDIVNESLLKLARAIHTIGMVASPNVRAYVMQTVERTAIDFCRKIGREQAVPLELAEKLAAPDLDSFAGSPLAKAILQLQTPYRHAILLKYAQGYNNKEIASILECTVSKVEKLLSRGKKQLRQLLDEEKREC